jgi:esterase/lipase superfamily enzyme
MMMSGWCGCPPGTALRTLIVATMLLASTGCESTTKLMPTPTLYARGDVDPFPDVPPAFQNNKVEVLYVTDRALENDSDGKLQYGYKRSRSVAYGVAEVQIGKDVSWDQLVKASRSSKRDVELEMTVSKKTELGRLPPTPKTLIELPPHIPIEPATSPTTAPTTSAAEMRAEIDQTIENFKRDLAARLAMSPRKDVYIFVHGYSNTFNDSVITVAQLWHFLGRQGVPVAYSWPAGRGGLLRGYTYDRESSEFTVYHLKEMIRLIASCPEVEKINIISHSRGTDVAMSALRELHLEISGSGRSTREVLKLATLVVAAPDVDMDIFIQRMATARLGRVPERAAIYICKADEALGISSWLFGGMNRLGKLQSNVFTPEELATLRQSRTVQIVEARVSNAGAYGHNYFYSNPAVSSDLILLMRYAKAPGAEYGRPLTADAEGFWVVDDDYLKNAPPATQPQTASR